ncbi:unnamed protein product [Nezara viridula]|uniref:Uncharacterized protein n=1 Tax=Nezara viridula TaxID=85310 RepID=A0A9P0E7Q7_NEZVI|nr:unnamed protein product [Nezara viridula]
MLSYISSIWQFLNYWYFRYLMVTELYMVEKWERAFFNTVIVVFLSILSYFNLTLLQYTSRLFTSESYNVSET